MGWKKDGGARHPILPWVMLPELREILQWVRQPGRGIPSSKDSMVKHIHQGGESLRGRGAGEVTNR